MSLSVQSEVINWLRFPLIIGVVFIHNFGDIPYDLDAMHAAPFSGINIYNWIRICLSHVFTHISVPIFYLISGYLFYYNLGGAFSAQIYKNKLKKRFQSLFIPYIIWNVIAILVVVGLKICAHILNGKPISNILLWFQDNGWWHLFWDSNVWGESTYNWLGIETHMSGPVDLPLWYLRDLMVVVLISPIIFAYLKYTKFYGIIILAFAYVSRIWPNIHGLSLTAVFFFSFGAYFAINGRTLVEEFKKVRIFSYALALLLSLPMVWYDGKNTVIGSVIYPFFIITGVISVFNIAVQLIEKGVVKSHSILTQSTFFIFALHTLLVLRISSYAINAIIGGGSAFAMILSYTLTPLLAIAICLLLYIVIKRLSPRALSILNGNRV